METKKNFTNMKLTKILGGVALSVLLASGMASCSTELEPSGITTKSNLVVSKAPKIASYSGKQYWGQNSELGFPFETRANGGDGTITWEDILNTSLDFKAEAEYVDKRLPEKNGNLEGLDEDFVYYTDKAIRVELIPIFGQSSTTHEIGIFYYDSTGELHKAVIWENLYFYYGGYMNSFHEANSWVNGQQIQKDAMDGRAIEIPANTYFGFYFNGNNNNGPTTYYTASHLNEEVYVTEGEGSRLPGDPTSKVHAVTWNYNGKTYLGLEDWTDMDFQDLVFTLTPELSTVDSTTFDPKDPNTPEEPGEQPGDGNNPNDPNNPNNPNDPNNPNNPDTPSFDGTVDNHTNEVETNLGFDMKGQPGEKYPESHLSIHVRSAVDVDIFIPMPLDLICPADDMEIVKKHFKGEMVHGGEFQNAQTDADGKVIMEGGLLSKVTYQIDKWTVELYVEYVEAGYTSTVDGETFTEDGIHIRTKGLEGNTELMDYLQENYGDGITFEIWNYYNEGSDKNEILANLNEAVIKFIGELPDWYINSFGKEDGQTDTNADCTVNLDDSVKDDFEYQGEGAHLNGSENNQIFENKAHKEAANQNE